MQSAAHIPEVEVVLGALDTSYNSLINRATSGLSGEQLLHLPTQESNSIAWLVWHLSRWKDRYAALLTGLELVWTAQGWAQRFGMDATADGFGDTPEHVAAFRPARDLLFGYAEAAHNATVERIASLTPDVLDREFETAVGPRPGRRVLVMMLMDFTQHNGQVAYIRGMLTGRGWNPL